MKRLCQGSQQRGLYCSFWGQRATGRLAPGGQRPKTCVDVSISNRVHAYRNTTSITILHSASPSLARGAGTSPASDQHFELVKFEHDWPLQRVQGMHTTRTAPLVMLGSQMATLQARLRPRTESLDGTFGVWARMGPFAGSGARGAIRVRRTVPASLKSLLCHARRHRAAHGRLGLPFR
jgi:hypothetical protein